MAQQMQGFDPALGQTYACKCGGVEHDMVEKAIITYNRLNHKQLAIAQIMKLKCTKCGTLFNVSEEGVKKVDEHAERVAGQQAIMEAVGMKPAQNIKKEA
jgi:hypothetical protein